MKYWCDANSNLVYFIELTTALGGRESLEIAVTTFSYSPIAYVMFYVIKKWLIIYIKLNESVSKHEVLNRYFFKFFSKVSNYCIR